MITVPPTAVTGAEARIHAIQEKTTAVQAVTDLTPGADRMTAEAREIVLNVTQAAEAQMMTVVVSMVVTGHTRRDHMTRMISPHRGLSSASLNQGEKRQFLINRSG
jgi:hypothetical protein